jgi:hypothetical protein
MCFPYKSLLMPLYKPPCMLRVDLAKSGGLLGGASRRRTAQYFGFPYRGGPPKALGTSEHPSKSSGGSRVGVFEACKVLKPPGL